MDTQEKINKIAQDLMNSEKTEKDILFSMSQMLSSMYNEQKRERDEYRDQLVVLQEIRELVRGHEKRLNRMEWIVGIAISIVGLSAAWAVPEVLSTIFS